MYPLVDLNVQTPNMLVGWIDQKYSQIIVGFKNPGTLSHPFSTTNGGTKYAYFGKMYMFLRHKKGKN